MQSSRSAHLVATAAAIAIFKCNAIGLDRIGGSGKVGEGGWTTMVSVTNKHWGTQLPPGNHGRKDTRMGIGRDSGR